MAMEIGHVHIKTYDPQEDGAVLHRQFRRDDEERGPQRQYPAQPARAAAQRHHHHLRAQNRKQMMGIEHIALQTDNYAGDYRQAAQQRRARHAGAGQQRPPRRLHRSPRRCPDGADRAYLKERPAPEICKTEDPSCPRPSRIPAHRRRRRRGPRLSGQAKVAARVGAGRVGGGAVRGGGTGGARAGAEHARQRHDPRHRRHDRWHRRPSDHDGRLYRGEGRVRHVGRRRFRN